jgi:cAMP-binding proteins - catabolite gene activator and regulatory subunit of cAMP-dependent protein kinases
VTAVVDPFTVLSHVALFGDLSEDELRALAHRTAKYHMKAGEILFSEGDPCQGFYVVESGEMKIFKTASSGREQVLTVDVAGSSIAEIPVFDGGPYPASAVATVDTTLLFVSKRDFRTLILEHPDIGLKVLKNVGSRLRRLIGLIEELSFTTVRNRLLLMLVRLARAEGQHTARGTEVTLPANQEMASQIGTVRELVSRNLSRLQAEGLLRLDGKQAIIPDVDALAATAEHGGA